MAKRGPKTEGGKAIARLNAVRHGVLSPTPVIPILEREEDWQAHRDGIVASLAPRGHLETTLAERVALLSWRLQRVARFELEAIMLGQERVEEDISNGEVTRTPGQDDEVFWRLHERARLLGLLLGLPDAEPLPGEDALKILSAVADVAEVTEEVVIRASIPAGVSPGEFAGWTAGLVRQSLAAVAVTTWTEPIHPMWQVVCHALYDEVQWKQAVRLRPLKQERMTRERLLPDEPTLNKVIRYEAHLHRQLVQTLHELEALQARRQGDPTPLARLDVQELPEQ